MALSRTLIRTYAIEHCTHPALALAAANRRIRADSQSDLFVTVFYAVLDPESGTLAFCNAGHNPAYLFPAQDVADPQELGISGLPLGILEDGKWEQGSAEVAPGDMLVIYSDGITEAQNTDGALFGLERLRAVLQANRLCPARDVHRAVLAKMRSFVGDAPQSDDVTLMIVTREPETPRPKG